ncbi:PTS sugar transporter subunit IIA [Candidatus Epulonipiscium viviparus]|uniref:PTS sugar transporter subunit IIA n=1 Tax=Candidatus Epulonipiscium viviparus TaxID=420336 RepID=UPI00016C089B|nr:PTS glucose transporter subunit IIA [Candidatus Epulopiscium viviparus]
MGLFNKQKGLLAPVSGQCISLTDVDDTVFSTLMLGDGIAIEPTEGVVVAPADGTVELVMNESEHTVGLKLRNDVEVLIHVGVNTADLKGKGFKCLVRTGDKVKSGMPLIEFDKKIIEDNGYKATTIFIISDKHDQSIKFKNETDIVTAGKDIVLDL